ncbi:MAG: DUF4410 domain-containing protein [Gammaproteobacteria bacterium]
MVNVGKSRYGLTVFALMGALLVGCSSKSVSMSPATSLRFLGDNIQVNVVGQNIEQRVLEQLTREIKGQLIISGFDLDTESSNNINLNVHVTEFTPGNAALRLTIGFGAGRGSLVYIAEYTDQEGKSLAKMEGQERFTGMEVGFNQNYGGATTLGGEETATKVLLKEAAKHIVELALNPTSK